MIQVPSASPESIQQALHDTRDLAWLEYERQEWPGAEIKRRLDKIERAMGLNLSLNWESRRRRWSLPYYAKIYQLKSRSRA